jgi:archaellum biogenesis ATPase FlaH
MAEQNGFEMISPAESGILPSDVLLMLDELSQTDDAAEIIIILDTLKKFTDLMNKKIQSEFYNILRKLVAKNATVIIAGHTNKYPDEHGNLVYEGTSDTMNDIDCAYSINLMTPSEGDVVVEFRRVKSRGDVVSAVSYGYRRVTGMSYYDIVDSVCKLNEQESSLVSEQNKVQEKLNKYESEKLFVQHILNNGPLIQSDIVKIYTQNSNDANEVHHGLVCEFSKSSLMRALSALTNIAWTTTRNRENNALTYELLNSSFVEIQRPINNVIKPGAI